MKYHKLLLLTLLTLACQPANEQTKPSIKQTNEQEFQVLMHNIAQGWSTQNTELALSSFDEDAIYMEPPDTQYFRGHQQLRPYFDALTADHSMQFHHLWFDDKTQSGVGEFTFSSGGDTATVGIVVVELTDGKIKFWREYLQTGPTDFIDFLKIENKNWQWHIGNYPEPLDSLESE